MLQPLNDNIIVKAPTKETETKGGVLLPSTVDTDRPETGEVVAVGREVAVIVPGDRVVFKKFAPDEFTDDGVEYLILNVEDVLAKIV